MVASWELRAAFARGLALAGGLDTTVHDPMDLYAAQQNASLRAAARTLSVRINPTNILPTNTEETR